MIKKLPNFKEMSTAKLAFFGLCIVVILFILTIVMAVHAPAVLGAIGDTLIVILLLAIAYGFCYATIHEFRNGSNW